MVPPTGMIDNPINAVTTKFVRTSTNKMRCPIFCVSRGVLTWRLNCTVVDAQAHDAPVRCMVWSHNDTWMVTGDHAGYIKYWQSNMNNVKMFQGHKEPLRGIRYVLHPVFVVLENCALLGFLWHLLG
ncbi:WDR33 [Cordylochernes scorpioides]|uniref:WDR33 n=1 Tax=Cordylochernes scorpioides TaxID=51811 RepID=A0ABY6L9N4_9ARAC|nr:WDR33 [Cordylochernes scorpioides]